MNRVIAIEGLDRLGKSTLIQGIQNRLGFHQVIHFGKPQVLDIYNGAETNEEPAWPLYRFQRQSFIESMILARSGAHIIFDRWHLGEAVYAPLYRKYSGEYVFELEKQYLSSTDDVRLILLAEDFSCSKHFVSDGQSFDDKKRVSEQELFLDAFRKSKIAEKRLIWVTDTKTGLFRKPTEILNEALS